jgi:ketosteroid isomerase-like protein
MRYLIIPLLFLSACAMAQEPDSSSALSSMRDAERNFARASVMIGRNAAFAENFAEVSAIFTDKWITNGKQYSRERKASPLVLKWEPEFMDIAASRDFGISTGPWEAQEYRPNTHPIATGYFLTVWKKESDGKWKVILDGGSSTPAVKNNFHHFYFPAGADKPVLNPPFVKEEIAYRELSMMEETIQKEWDKNPLPSTYFSFLSPLVRIQLSGHLPTTNRDSINVMLSGFDKSMTWKTAGMGAATSGDLGYTYGIIELRSNQAKNIGHYVRIWKKQPATGWKIMLEMLNID